MLNSRKTFCEFVNHVSLIFWILNFLPKVCNKIHRVKYIFHTGYFFYFYITFHSYNKRAFIFASKSLHFFLISCCGLFPSVFYNWESFCYISKVLQFDLRSIWIKCILLPISSVQTTDSEPFWLSTVCLFFFAHVYNLDSVE